MASEGPLLATLMVYSMVSPTFGASSFTSLVTARSAEYSTVVSAVGVLLAALGSYSSAEAVAELESVPVVEASTVRTMLSVALSALASSSTVHSPVPLE